MTPQPHVVLRREASTATRATDGAVREVPAWAHLGCITIYATCAFLGSAVASPGRTWAFGLVGGLGLVSLLLILCVSIRMHRRWANLHAIFFLSFYVFTQVQGLLFAVPGVTLSVGVPDMRLYYSSPQILAALLFGNVCMVALFQGTLLSARSNLRGSGAYRAEQLERAVLATGRTIVAITIVPFFVYLAVVFSAAASVGYGALQDLSNYGSSYLVKVLSLVAQYFVAGVLLVLIGYKNDKAKFTLWQLVFSLYPVALLLIGERTTSTALLAVTLVLRFRYFGRGGWREVAAVLTPAAALLAVFPTILQVRREGIISFGSLWAGVTESGVGQSVVDSLAGIGYSVLPAIETMARVPEARNYEAGLTYAAALTGWIPRLGIASEKSQLGRWLQDQMNLGYGPGFSIPAEAYLNFGLWLSIPALLVLGALLGRLIIVTPDLRAEGLSICVAAIFMANNLTWPRREFLGLAVGLFYVLIPVYLLLRARYATESRRDAV